MTRVLVLLTKLVLPRARGGHESSPPDEGDSDLSETLDSLQMPRAALREWFQQGRDFCNRHGSERHYAELLSLYERCVGELDRERKSGT